jgi:hypothetical protein
MIRGAGAEAEEVGGIEHRIFDRFGGKSICSDDRTD